MTAWFASDRVKYQRQRNDQIKRSLRAGDNPENVARYWALSVATVKRIERLGE